jgi:isoquinoline 1-oxidoreductase beta subunit
MSAQLDRRAFLQVSGTALGGLLVHAGLAAPTKSASARATPTDLTVFVRIEPNNQIVIGARGCEIGQGVKTALPMLIAEELNVPWSMITVEQLPYVLIKADNAAGFVGKYGPQGAGGSTSISDAWTPLRQAGAQARWLLVAAAAQRWSRPATELTPSDGFVRAPDGARLSYGELAAAAAKLAAPKDPLPLKAASEFRIVGKPVRVADAHSIVTGKRLYGLDASVPGQRIAVVARCPYFDGTLERYDDRATRKIAGVHAVVPIKGAAGGPLNNALADGVAIIADNTWAAMRGRQALQVTWKRGPWATDSSAALERRARAAFAGTGAMIRSDGNFAAARADARKTIEAQYLMPFLAHATLEPQNCIIELGEGRARVIAPTQSPGSISAMVSRLTGIARLNIAIELTRSGGGFGRRLDIDFIAEAVQIAQAVHKPIKLVWTREDDMANDFYRPFGLHALSATLDADNKVTGWQHRTAATPRKYRIPGLAEAPDWVALADPDAYPAGVVPNYQNEFLGVEFGLARGWWRAPQPTFVTFATESFVDEVAHAAGRDPLELRLELLGPPRQQDYRDHGGPKMDTGRLAAVLREAARRIAWGTAVPAGHGRGLAMHFTFGGYAAHAMQVSVIDGAVKIHRCICVVDVGQPVNPLGIEAQMIGGTIDGISTALRLAITVKDGLIEQQNFTDYRLLSMAEAPDVEVHIMPSSLPPAGAGEMGIPTAAPALTNAIFAATGNRIRRLPIANQL